MNQLKDRMDDQIFIPIEAIAKDLGCTTANLERWLKEQDDITLRKSGKGRIEVDPLQLRQCLDEVS